jgi:hypothetical protein
MVWLPTCIHVKLDRHVVGFLRVVSDIVGSLRQRLHASANRPAGGGDTTSTSHPSLGHNNNNIFFAIDRNCLTVLLMNFAKHAK